MQCGAWRNTHRFLFYFRRSKHFVEALAFDIYPAVTIDSGDVICTDVVGNLVSCHAVCAHSFRHRVIFGCKFGVDAHSCVNLTSEIIDHIPDFLLSDFQFGDHSIQGILLHAEFGTDLIDGVPFLLVHLIFYRLAEYSVDMLLALECLPP